MKKLRVDQLAMNLIWILIYWLRVKATVRKVRSEQHSVVLLFMFKVFMFSFGFLTNKSLTNEVKQQTSYLCFA